VNDQPRREPAEIRADIEETRREVGETAAALAEKADFKSQAKARIEGVKGRFAGKREDVKGRVAGKREDVKGRIAGTRATTVERVKSATPESAGHAASTLATTARRNPVPIAVAAAVTAAFALGRVTGRH
jgi:hypothetical protein